MTVKYLPHDILKKAAFDLVNKCLDDVKNGVVDVSEVESSVRNYCESIAELPLEEGMGHSDDLNELMSLVTKLGEELAEAKNSVHSELGRLERMRKANVAYQSPDGIPPRIMAGDDGE